MDAPPPAHRPPPPTHQTTATPPTLGLGQPPRSGTAARAGSPPPPRHDARASTIRQPVDPAAPRHYGRSPAPTSRRRERHVPDRSGNPVSPYRPNARPRSAVPAATAAPRRRAARRSRQTAAHIATPPPAQR